MRQNRLRSLAVENTPACPAIPCSSRALPSCTTPRSGPWLFTASVGAMRLRHPAGGADDVSRMHRGEENRTPSHVRGDRVVAHAERGVELLPREGVERLTTDAPDQLTEQDEAGVAVEER